jgi:hypothetical protein
MRKTKGIKDTAKKIAGKTVRIFEGITLKSEEDNGQQTLEKVAKVTKVAIPPTRNNTEYSKSNQVSKHVTSATSVTLNDSEKLELLRNWLRNAKHIGEVYLSQIKQNIQELKFYSSEKNILRTLCESGDLIGVEIFEI